MDKKIPTGKLCGTITAPPSKSMTHRLLIMAALSGKECRIKNPLFCEDTEITLNALRKLGFQFEVYEKEICFNGRKNDPAGVPTIYVGNSGTSARFLTALAAVLGIDCIIDGSERMRQRPMAPLFRALQELGANLEHRHSRLPLRINGKSLDGAEVQVDSQQSSQFLSALLLTAPFLEKGLTIHLDERTVSQAYVDMTLALMKNNGITIEQQKTYYYIPAGQSYHLKEATVEGDYSGAACFLMGAAVSGGEVQINNLLRQSLQGDRVISDILGSAGAEIITGENQVCLRGINLRAIDWDMNSHPDLVPVVAVAALFAEGKSIMRNVAHLQFKESDRLHALVSNIQQLGGRAHFENESLIIQPEPLFGRNVNTFNDHRIAMSFAMVGLCVPGVVIENGECVKKSYPKFWEDFKILLWENPR